MPIVTYNGHEFECTTALKGADYIRLLDENGCKIVAFEAVVDFSLFTIADGSWTDDTGYGTCCVALIGTDGSGRKSNIPGNRLSARFSASISLPKNSEKILTDKKGYTYYTYGSILCNNSSNKELYNFIMSVLSRDEKVRVVIEPFDAELYLKYDDTATSAMSIDDFFAAAEGAVNYSIWYIRKHYVYTHVEINLAEGYVKLTPTFDVAKDSTYASFTCVIDVM